METTQQVLRREAQRARYRHAWWIALVAGVSGNALLVLAMWAAAPRPAPAAVTVMPATATATPAPIVVVSTPVVPPVVIVMPAPAGTSVLTPAFGDLGPCPAPHKARPSGSLRQPELEDELVGFAGAPSDSRWLAVWTRDALHVSRDGGASWDRVLDGPGEIIHATFDCHGRVLAMRDGNGLGIRDGAREAWRIVPGVTGRIPREDDDYPHHVAELIGGGRSIAIIGPSTGDDGESNASAALSDDGGATWRHADLGWYEGKAAGEWTGDTLRVMVPWTDCMSEGIRMVTVSPTGIASHEVDEWTSEVAMDRGNAHGITESCAGYLDTTAENVLCAWRQGQSYHALPIDPIPSGRDNGYDLTLIDGPVDVVVRDFFVQSIGARKLGRAREWPEGATALGTDLAGRLWGRDSDGTLIRR